MFPGQGAKVANGNLGNGGECSTQLAIRRNSSEDSPLDFSRSGQFRQEVRGTGGIPDPKTIEASPSSPPPTASEAVDPKTVEIANLKAEIGDLREKLQRSRDDYSKLVFQKEKYSMGETTALLKAIYWKGRLHMKYDDLAFRHLVVRMKSRLFWDENFRGRGSLLTKFRENLTEKRDRDCGSIKRKWNRIFKQIARRSDDFFQRKCFADKVDHEEKTFLIKLAKAYCIMKGIDVSTRRHVTTAAPQPRAASIGYINF